MMFPLFETFIAVYETKSFTKAGKYLYLSQPTVTVRIRKLEKELETVLFSRGQNQEVIPTESALLVYKKALEYLQEWDQLQANIQEQILRRHPVKIGVSHSAAISLMPNLFEFFSQDLDCLEVEISMHDSETVFELVSSHSLHFGIVEKPLVNDQTETFPLFKDELVLAGNIEIGTFFIREVGSGVGHYIRKFLRDKPLIPKNIVKMNNNEMIVAHIKAGLGASLVSKSLLSEGIPYERLGKKYHREFSGVSFAEERDPIIQQIIQKIKNNSNFCFGKK